MTLPPDKPRTHLPPEILGRARALRQESTTPEQLLWSFLRDHRFKGRKFRRQHPIPPYIVDFYCHEAHLAIELDGSGHLDEAQERYDEKRTKYLEQHGVRVLRFYNNQVLTELEAVLRCIWDELD